MRLLNSDTLAGNAARLTADSGKHESGADPLERLRGEISVILVVKPHYGFTTVRQMQYNSQHCCDKRR